LTEEPDVHLFWTTSIGLPLLLLKANTKHHLYVQNLHETPEFSVN